MRIGFGYDVHRLVSDRPLILGGIQIPSELGLAGHSDADVLLHAITDAILGALGLGDIGAHFPDTEAEWKDADSSVFLKAAGRLARERGYRVGNIDTTVVLQKPKLRSYIEEIRENISAMLGIRLDQISVKATTSETIGFVGREEGAAVYAVVLLEHKPV